MYWTIKEIRQHWRLNKLTFIISLLYTVGSPCLTGGFYPFLPSCNQTVAERISAWAWTCLINRTKKARAAENLARFLAFHCRRGKICSQLGWRRLGQWGGSKEKQGREHDSLPGLSPAAHWFSPPCLGRRCPPLGPEAQVVSWGKWCKSNRTLGVVSRIWCNLRCV